MAQLAEIANYGRLFDDLYGQLNELLADLPSAALLYKPFEHSPWQVTSSTLGLIVAHAVSSTIYLLRRAEWAAGKREWKEIDGDEGSEEFGPANHDIAYLRQRAARTQALMHEMLAGFSTADLDAIRAHPKRVERTFSVRYDLVHAIDHLSQHIGHGQLTRQLWAIEQAR